MNLTTREDIDAPKNVVYSAVTDFDRFERMLMRRGVDVLRDEAHPPRRGSRARCAPHTGPRGSVGSTGGECFAFGAARRLGRLPMAGKAVANWACNRVAARLPPWLGGQGTQGLCSPSS